jgi:AcrR family transcriptional regulator
MRGISDLASNVCLKQSYHMSNEALGETGIKILTAAETLFAEKGYDGVSLRQITNEAGVNLAAVNYHYNDKQSLYLEVLTYRLRQLSQARLDRLAAAEVRSDGGPLPLADIVDIFAAPLLQPDAASMPTFGPASSRLIGRTLLEPLDFLAPVLAIDFQPAVARCGQAIRRHLPKLPPADFIWRYSFVIGALHHTAATLHDMKTRTNGFCANDDGATALRNFRHFAIAAVGQ